MEILKVHLLQLKLYFILKKNTLQFELKQFYTIIVDANQFFNILTRLISKLVL